MNYPKAIRNYLYGMISSNMSNKVTSIVLGKAISLDEDRYPAIFIQFKTETNTTPDQRGNTEEQVDSLDYEITIAISEKTAVSSNVPEDLLDDLKKDLKDLMYDDVFMMKGLPDFDPEGSNDQGLTSGIFYAGTTAIYANEGSGRPLSYAVGYQFPYNEERVLEYRYEDFETFTVEIVDHEDQNLVLIEAKGDLATK